MTSKDPRPKFEAVRNDLLNLALEVQGSSKEAILEAVALLSEVERVVGSRDTDRLKLNRLAKMVTLPSTGRRKKALRDELIIDYVAEAMFVEGLNQPSRGIKEDVADFAGLGHNRTVEKILSNNAVFFNERKAALGRDRDDKERRMAELAYEKHMAQLADAIKALARDHKE